MADDTQDLKNELEQVREQNRLMQKQLEQQRQMIDQLNQKVSAMQTPGAPPVGEPPATATSAPSGGSVPNLETGNVPAKSDGFLAPGNVRISGEGGVGFFETGKNGYYPDAQFRVDEARLFLDAPLWHDVYFYGELNLQTREEGNPAGAQLGELYLDFEDLAQFGSQDHLLNVRAGQLYIPFGEEYQVRYAIDNPLISHSLGDFWGISPGLEIYGAAEKFSYALAVQNSGISTVEENTADKTVAARLGFNPVPWLHFSGSAMRTGDVNVTEDYAAALWIGNGFFQSIGSANTSLFHANLAEVDGQVKWRRGSLKTAAGYAAYNDNNPLAGDHRDFYYYYAELVQGVTGKLYGAVRLSQMDVPQGYPLVENNSSDSGVPTRDLWRLSLGAGYRFNQNLLLKAEYLLEHGSQTDGSPRNHEDMLAVEGAFKF